MTRKRLRGEENNNAKLTEAQVKELREVWAKWVAAGSSKGYGALGEAFGLSGWTVRDVVNRVTWKHVP